jgi:mannose-6-phosphate isomerase
VSLDAYAFEPRRVEKPWGHEVIWAHSERYAGKELFVREGHALSLQYHEVKDETIYVQQGRIELQVGPRDGELASEVVGPGRAFRLVPGTVHRMRALEDSLLLEVSTPDLDDVVRLEDRYGRDGTSVA